MAGTLLPVPTLGASDWSSWITLVDAVRRGYLAASYTNFAASAESALAAGSLVEVAGAVYSFTETAIDYTGAGSTNSDLYIYVKPDAVVSTCSMVAWGSAPVWVSAKQGFYASAASTTRAIGGMYVGGAGSYGSKYFYIGDLLNYCLVTNQMRPLLKKILSIGEWNMDATAQVNILHGLAWAKLRHARVLIRADSSVSIPSAIPSPYPSTDALAFDLWHSLLADYVRIERRTGGAFDSSTFDGTASTVSNRGDIYIEYEA